MIKLIILRREGYPGLSMWARTEALQAAADGQQGSTGESIVRGLAQCMGQTGKPREIQVQGET